MMKAMTYKLSYEQSKVRDVVLVMAASLFISLVGQLSFPLPFTPVPLSFRLQMILSISALLGAKRGFLATLLFIAQGLTGVSLFANGLTGMGGLVGPSGGYYIGFLIAAYLVGWVQERVSTGSLKRTAISFCGATLIVYGFGMLHLSHFVGFKQAFLMGVVPFILPDLMKTLFCIKLCERLKSQIGHVKL